MENKEWNINKDRSKMNAQIYILGAHRPLPLSLN